jgi:hypothetical protein
MKTEDKSSKYWMEQYFCEKRKLPSEKLQELVDEEMWPTLEKELCLISKKFISKAQNLHVK